MHVSIDEVGPITLAVDAAPRYGTADAMVFDNTMFH